MGGYGLEPVLSDLGQGLDRPEGSVIIPDLQCSAVEVAAGGHAETFENSAFGLGRLGKLGPDVLEGLVQFRLGRGDGLQNVGFPVAFQDQAQDLVGQGRG